jgi:hypothetical protein
MTQLKVDPLSRALDGTLEDRQESGAPMPLRQNILRSHFPSHYFSRMNCVLTVTE